MRVQIILFLMLVNMLSAMTQGSDTIDSLKLVFENAKHDTIKCSILNEMISAEYDENIWSKYNQQLLDISQKNLKTAKNEEREYYLAYYALALNNFGYLYEKQGDISKAFEYFNKSLPIQEEIDDKLGMAGSLLNLGMIFRQQGNIPKALEYYHRALKLQILIDNKSGIATSYNNIGFVYDSQGEYLKAYEYYNKALNINFLLKDKSSIAICYTNIAFLYSFHNELFFNGSKDECMRNGHIKAIEYLNKSIKLQEEINDKSGIASSLNSLGSLYETFGDPYCSESTDECYEHGQKKALDLYTKSLVLRQEINNKVGITISYECLSSLLLKQNKIGEAFRFADLSLQTAKELGYPENIQNAAILLKKIHEKKGEYKEALEMHELYIQMRDSIINQENRKATYKKQFQIEYEIQFAKDSITHITKEKEEKYKHEKAISEQRMYTIGGLIGFILMIFVAFISYRAFKNKKKANILLEQKNIEIYQQKEEISSQRDEIESQRDLVTIQKEEIEEVHKEVTDSINYAKRIQEAVLPISELSRSVLGEHFVLFKPKNIVSGDFYWTTKIENQLFVAVADCTGHGVPGAFMSMLGISFLNEIVQKQEIKKANQILNILRMEIINALQQKGLDGEQKDGMDISLLIVNSDTHECQWAGANNPLYIIAKGELTELHGDKMPIAIYPTMKDFTNHGFVLQKGDRIYMFTDGFADQFGGPQGKKFKYKPFKELLTKNTSRPMSEQQSVLMETFLNWKGKLDQVDDVLVLGIKI